MDHERPVVHRERGPLSHEGILLVRGSARRLARSRSFEHDRQIRLDAPRGGGRSAKPHLLLDAPDRGHGDGRTALDQAREHRASGAVVEGLPLARRAPGFVRGVEHGVGSHGHSLLRLLARAGADVEVEVVGGGHLVALGARGQMRGKSAHDAADSFGADAEDLAGEDARIDPPDPAKPEPSLLLDRGHHQADLVHVRAEHHVRPAPASVPRAASAFRAGPGARRSGIDARHEASHGIHLEGIHVLPRVLREDRADGFLAAAHAGRVGDLLQNIFPELRRPVGAHFNTSTARHSGLSSER